MNYNALCTFFLPGATPQENHKIFTGDELIVTGGECIWGGVKIPFSHFRKALSAGWVAESTTDLAQQAVLLAQTDPERAQEFPHLSTRRNSAQMEDVGVEAFRQPEKKVRVRAAEGEASIEDALQGSKKEVRRVKPISVGKSHAGSKASSVEEGRVNRVRTPTHPQSKILT